MKIANTSSLHYTLSDIGRVEVELALPQKDQRDENRLGLVNTVLDEIKVQLEKNLGIDTQEETPTKNTTKPFTLKIRITRCTVGNRVGRIIIGELGVGWAKLYLEWQIIDSSSKEILFGPATEKMRDSGAIGFADIVESSHGPKAVHIFATQYGPTAITWKAKEALHKGIMGSDQTLNTPENEIM